VRKVWGKRGGREEQEQEQEQGAGGGDEERRRAGILKGKEGRDGSRTKSYTWLVPVAPAPGPG